MSSASQVPDPPDVVTIPTRRPALDEQQDHAGGRVVEQVRGDVGEVEVDFVAGGDDVAEAEAASEAVIEQREPEAAALRDHRDVPVPHPVQAAFVVGHRTEPDRDLIGDVDVAFGIRPEYPHLREPVADRAQFILARRAAGLLGEPRTDDHCEPDTRAPALLHKSGHASGVDHDERDVHRTGHRGYVRIAGQSVDRLVPRVHRVHGTAIAMLGKDPLRQAGNGVRDRRRPDDGDR